jgi:hypothetical protein
MLLLNLFRRLLSENQLSGSVVIGNWSLFQTLNIADNAFTGTIPPLDKFPQLGVVHVSNNRLSGDFPPLPVGLFECDAIRDDGKEGNCFTTCPTICCPTNTPICVTTTALSTTSDSDTTNSMMTTSTIVSESLTSSTSSTSKSTTSRSSTTTTTNHNVMTSAASSHRGTPGALGIGSWNWRWHHCFGDDWGVPVFALRSERCWQSWCKISKVGRQFQH